MKKRIISFLLVAVMIIGMIPMQAFAATDNNIPQAVDTSWYDPSAASGTTFEIADAADLRGAARLSQAGVTFSGYTLKLTADIDLNPGWDAEVKVSGGKATLPDAPTVEFEGFATFDGTFDGNSKTISGVYMMQRLTVGSANLAFIEILNGTVKNLKINNSLIYADIADGVNDCKVGGIAARTKNASVLIDTVYVDIDVWYRGWSWQRVAGVVAKTDSAAATFKNVAYVGTVGAMDPNYGVPHYNEAALPGDMTMSQIIGDGNWKANVLENVALNGEVIIPSNVAAGAVDATAPIGKCVGGSVVRTNVAANTALPTTVAAMNPTAYTTTLAAFNLWPSATADGNTATYDEGENAYVKYYSNATNDNYTSYLKTLENNGYVKCSEYTVGNNSYALYQKAGAYSVYVSYLAKVEAFGSARMRVFVENFGAEYDLNSAASTSNVCAAQIWQLDVDNKTSGENGGMSYVIRLTDGTFIVVDGGYSTDAEAKNLYKVLSENNPNGGKPVIRAWFLTHLHGDHTGALTNFAKSYASSVTVEGFYYNFPGNDVSGERNEDRVSVSSILAVDTAMDMFGGAARYSKIHSGMTFGFAGVTATVLGTHEDVKQSYYHNGLKSNDFTDGNDTSTVIKFNVDGQSLMMLADARIGMSRQLQYSYAASVLKSDMVQVSHHGYTGVQDALYELIDADVALWPMDLVGKIVENNKVKENVELFKDYYNSDSISANKYLRNNTAEIIPSYENVCLDIPYAATTYSKGAKVVDVSKAYLDKLYALATQGNGPDTSWYKEDKSTFYLYDANDLLGFANLAKAGNTFAGKTIVLMANIDLNPGWNAAVTIGDKVVFPVAPATVWPEIASFAGTLDGNGYTISGLYKSMTVAGNTGAYGGLFNVLSGSVKNLIISNSFILATNTAWGSGNVHVGGVAGEVNAGAVIYSVYMDATVEVWYKSDGHCNLGGAYAYANGAATVSGFIFVGRIGNTSNANAVNYACPSDRPIVIATVVANTNYKGCTTKNCLGLKTSIYSGKTYNGNNDRLGLWDEKSTASCVANTRESAAWLLTRPDDYGANFTWSDALGAICPNVALDVVNGTYARKQANTESTLKSNIGDENYYFVYTAEELLTVLRNGGNFAGKTIMLMANIDLNPGWIAAVSIESKVNVPAAPANVWPNIASFKGVLDGNGYSISGIYSFKTVSQNGAVMAVGGLFNTLDGGTVKNLKIDNSFMAVENTGWGSTNLHIGGIAGEVNAGSTVTNVYITDKVEIWHKSWDNCYLGGIFGFANGQYTLNNVVFLARIGYAGFDWNANYASSTSGKEMYIAQVIAHQNNKDDATVTNSLFAGDIYSKVNKANYPAHMGVHPGFPWKIKFIMCGKQTAEWLAGREDYRNAGFVYNETVGSAVPSTVVSLIEGTYDHAVNYAKKFATPEIFYQVSAINNGTYDIRFLSGIDNITDPARVGFDITIHVNGKSYTLSRDYTLKSAVYTSVQAAGQTVTAGDLNEAYEYLYTCSITGITATDNIVIDVAVVYEMEDGATITGNTVSFAFVCGIGTVIC